MDTANTPQESPYSTGSVAFLDDALIQHGCEAVRDVREALRERDELYRLIFKQAGDAIELIDAETLSFIEVNDTACRLVGYAREELVGQSLLVIQVDLDEAAIRARLTGLMQGRG